MQGKVIIITGGGSGMGRAMAGKFAEHGANVVVTGRTLGKLEGTKEEFKHFPGEIVCFQMDVRNVEDVEGMVKFAEERFGKIDGLVNNAAGNFTCAVEDLTPNGWNAVINIVLNGSFYCSQAVGKSWIKNGTPGAILNILATTAWTGAAGCAPSASGKAGVLALTKTLAVEWGNKYGIRVNAIAPGPIGGTGGADKMFPSEESYQHTLDSVPLKRLGTNEEISELALYLLSDKATYINGECITIDGGQAINRKEFLGRLYESDRMKKEAK